MGMTWNPVTGCTFGCPWCYARRMARRVHRMRGGKNPVRAELRAQTDLGGSAYTAQPDEVYPFGFYPTVYPHRLDQPIKRTKPADIFLGSMADIFDPADPDEMRDRIFATIANTPRHRYVVLTKRAREMHEYFTGGSIPRWVTVEGQAQAQHERLTGEDPSEWLSVKLPLPNLMLGVTVTNQDEAKERVPHLLETPAAYRMVSVEPMLGPVSLAAWLQSTGIDFVAIGAKTPGKALDDRYGCDECAVQADPERGCPKCTPEIEQSPRMWLRTLLRECLGAGVLVNYKHGNETPFVDQPGRVYDATIAEVMHRA